MRVINITYFQEFINKYKIKQEERASKGLGLQYFGPKEMQILLDKMPTIDAEPVRHGRWIDNSYPLEGFPIYRFNCSECNFLVNRIGQMKYCPNCGAKMNLRKD